MNGDESVYDVLSAADTDGRWAHGAGFDEVEDVVVTAPAPQAVDRDDLATYCLMLADDVLVASQRLAGWATNAPELEEEVALANIALDLLGQARTLLSRAGHLGAAEAYRTRGALAGEDTERSGAGPAGQDTERSGAGPAGQDTKRSGAGPADEDVLAYFRDERAFRNVVLAEIELGHGGGGDFARTMAWLLVLSSWRLALMSRLRASRDPVLAALAEKAVQELAYQREYAAEWVVRLGDGTAYSHDRMQTGLDDVWPFTEELFGTHPVEARLADAGVAVDPSRLRAEVDGVLDQVLALATLRRPERPAVGLVGGHRQQGSGGGRDGVHTEALGPALALMQALARAHPEATW